MGLRERIRVARGLEAPELVLKRGRVVGLGKCDGPNEIDLDGAYVLPINVFVNVPSCVPASPMEMGGHVLLADDMAPLLALDGVVGIAEVMNFPGVLNADPDVLAKIELGLRLGVPIDGHAPRVRGKDRCGYLAGAGAAG